MEVTMSEKDVLSFFEKVESDRDLRAQLKVLVEESEKVREARTAKVIQLAAQAGFDFTPNDIAAVREKNAARLSEDELRKFAAETGPTPLDCMPGWSYVL
jgi:predicted ribosomally synthesized peptide with nif11-like leader